MLCDIKISSIKIVTVSISSHFSLYLCTIYLTAIECLSHFSGSFIKYSLLHDTSFYTPSFPPGHPWLSLLGHSPGMPVIMVLYNHLKKENRKLFMGQVGSYIE